MFSELRPPHHWAEEQDKLYHLTITSVEKEELSEFSHNNNQVMDHFSKTKALLTVDVSNNDSLKGLATGHSFILLPPMAGQHSSAMCTMK